MCRKVESPVYPVHPVPIPRKFKSMEVDILGVFAHPDDLELTVGGTMLRMKSLGYTTGGLDVTRGEMGTRGTVEGRAKEAEDAAKILKLDVRANLGLADGHVFVDDPSRTAMVQAFRHFKPKLIVTHQIDDPHPDHDHIARLVREAARLASMRNYHPGSRADVIPVPKVAHNIFSRRVEPSFVVDISEFLSDKMAAIRAHASQFHNPESTEPETRLTDRRFLDELENRSRYFGSLIGVEAGEPFYVRETLNVYDPLDLLTQPMNLYS